MPLGKIQLRDRADYANQIERGEINFDDEAADLQTSGSSIEVCIKRTDGIHISAQYGDATCEIHFDPENTEAGYYTVSAGPFRGSAGL